MTYEQIITLISIIVAGITGLAAIATSVRGYFWSKDYRVSKQAELDAKDAEFQAKETQYTAQLALKDDKIRLLELIADREYLDEIEKLKERLTSVNNQQKKDIEELQKANERLKRQLEEAKSTNRLFVSNFPQANLNAQQKQALDQFVTASGESLNNLTGTADAYRVLERSFESTAAETGKISILGAVSPSKGVYEPKDENGENDHPEALQPAGEN
jgi:predicted RNase H-like nuclease (RuvC/YqgF family)